MPRCDGRTCWCLRFIALLGALGWAVPAQALPVACAVEATDRQLSAPGLCDALAKVIGRPVVRVEDARATHGESVQVIHSDVQWIVIWLVDGHVRAWTRVSKIEAARRQLHMLVSAAKALAKRLPTAKAACIRLEPNAGHKVRSAELTYPWATLRPCRQRMIEVVDPWWLPADTGAARAPDAG